MLPTLFLSPRLSVPLQRILVPHPCVTVSTYVVNAGNSCRAQVLTATIWLEAINRSTAWWGFGKQHPRHNIFLSWSIVIIPDFSALNTHPNHNIWNCNPFKPWISLSLLLIYVIGHDHADPSSDSAKAWVAARQIFTRPCGEVWSWQQG